MQGQGTKLAFESRVPTSKELNECIHIDMTSAKPWNPDTIKLKETTTSPFPSPEPIKRLKDNSHTYLDPTSDESLLHELNPSLVHLPLLVSNRLQLSTKSVSSITDDCARGIDVPSPRTFVSTDRHVKISEDMLADRFCIGPKKAQATLKATLQQGTRSAILPLSRRYKADRNFRTKQLSGKVSTDTLYADAKSLNGNIAAQLYSHKCGFTVIYPMPKADGEHIVQSLNNFIHEWGMPEYLILMAT